MEPSLAMCSKFWRFEGVLVVNWDGDVLGQSYGGLVGRQLKVCHSVHPMGPGWGDVWMWVCACLGGRQGTQRCRNQGCWLILIETPMLSNESCCWM